MTIFFVCGSIDGPHDGCHGDPGQLVLLGPNDRYPMICARGSDGIHEGLCGMEFAMEASMVKGLPSSMRFRASEIEKPCGMNLRGMLGQAEGNNLKRIGGSELPTVRVSSYTLW